MCRYEELIVCVKAMANLSASNISNICNQFKNTTLEGNTGIAPLELSEKITIIINCITCPFIVLFNVLVIIAVKRRPRLQSYTNILLACLAATDALTGVTAQPSYILWKTSQLLGIKKSNIIRVFYSSSLRALSSCTALHLALVTFERLIAIKFTMRYPYIITNQKLKFAIIAIWVYIFSSEILRRVTTAVLISLVLILCILFVAASYIILYREAIRQQKLIKIQQIPQQDVKIFTKESKALKTTVFVVGSMVLCFLPMGVALLLYSGTKMNDCASSGRLSWVRTCAMLNSLLNPLIYCWRQQEMRQFVFRISSAAVAGGNEREITRNTEVKLYNKLFCCQ